MELYTIDPANSNRTQAVIEGFESLIWTDRYADFGDFSLVTVPTAEMQSRLAPGKWLGFDVSDRIMVVDSCLTKQSEDSKTTLEVKGRSLERFFQDRAAVQDLNSADWVLTGTAGTIITQMVNSICIAGTGISNLDIIPGMTVTNLSGTSATMTISIKIGTLYERIKEICDTYNLGFRITYTRGLPELSFAVYTGLDRTGQWGIEFSKDLDNLSAPSYYKTQEEYKNIAYVLYKSTGQIVTTGVGSTPTGINRRVILVDANDVSITTDLTTALTQRGRDALAEHRARTLLDGTVNPDYPYRINVHYFLGDLVPLVAEDGTRDIARVTEHIWSLDSNGFKSYPTLSAL